MTNFVLAKLRRNLPETVLKRLPRRVGVVAVGFEESRKLNSKFFKKSVPANVLSFRYGEDYGEILVCPAVIRRDAKKQGNIYKYQMTWMILHGMIHLAGLHHEKSLEAAARVEKVERKILGKLFSS